MFRGKSKFDVGELTRRFKRLFDVSYRRLFLMVLACCLLLYMVPPIFRYLFISSDRERKDPLIQCMEDRITPFILQNYEYNANIRHVPPLHEENDIIPYVGNGYMGLEITHEASLNIKSKRSMQLPTKIYPIISLANGGAREATATEYKTGIVYRFQCFANYFVTYTYYAHRTIPSILMQEIRITNTRNSIEEIELILPRIRLENPTSRNLQLGIPMQSSELKEFELITGTVLPNPKESDNVIVISIVKPQLPRMLPLKKRGSTKVLYPIAIHYSKPVSEKDLKEAVKDTENKTIQAMTKMIQKLQTKTDSSLSSHSFKQEHINVWRDLWATGFTISTSKAENSLNGDRINATMYAVLSQVRSYEFEELTSFTAPSKEEISKALTYAEGCYDSYHTLQAENLWLPMNSLENLNSVVSSWMLTLEKQGCHNLIRAGASGVIQAMVLSFGSFRFSNQHLECNMHPKYLHRDFHFRRLNYGNKTHVNVSITVTDDNKAIINVALDRSDRSYYACDAGCLDQPVLLAQSARQFPVKLTEPLTAILYITEDKQHMRELHEAIHVREVVEAPAHEQHVIALHKHGHQLGGLPTLFWVSVCAIIIVFHVFLCKLIIKEYCEPSDKVRYRYNKP